VSLPWFPFNGKAFITDTLRLSTEAKGAYLMLMLDYYEQEKPPPDDDEVLASITGLPLDRWKHHRRVIEPLFTIKEGVWLHERIRDEIRNGHEKHSAKVARVKAATDAAARKAAERRSATVSVTEPKTDKPPKRTRHKSDNGPVTDSVSPSVTETHKQEQEQIFIGGGRAGARETNDPLPSPATDSVTGIEDQLDGTHADDGRIPIDLWKPDISGMTADDLALLNKFAAYHMDEGTFSRDWPSLWQKYRDDAKPKPKRAPPRVETNKRPEPLPGARVKISPDAMALAGEIERMCGLEHHPATVGLPLLLETWLSAWPSELIVGVIRNVMEQRNGEPPKTFKYFESAIARAFADTQRGVPTAAATTQGTTSYDRRKANSTSEVARRLAAEFETRDAGKRADGGEVLRIADGTVQAQ